MNTFSPTEELPRRKSLLLLGFLCAAVGSLVVWKLLGMPSTGIDDADIFLVYARNFSEGHGFVYNIGGERVEGFTSMLWVLICSGFFRIFQAPEIPLFILNICFGAITLIVCLRRLQHSGIFLILLASAPAWFAWCQVTLMESGLWCLLLTLVVLAVVEKRSRTVAILLPLLVLTRPESMMWGAWIILLLGVANASKSGWREGVKSVVLPGITFAGSLIGLILFRLRYFGYPVPNTFYAKVSSDFDTNCFNGMFYFFRYAISNPAVLLILILLIGVLVRGLLRKNRLTDRSWLMALCLLPGIGIPILVGGDHFGGFRFYQSIWPLLCLLAAWEFPQRLKRFNPRFSRSFPILLLCCGWFLFPLTANLKHEFGIAKHGRMTGAALNEIVKDLDEYPSVAVITAGGFKLAYDGKVADLMGLNSTEMAHAPGERNGFKNHAGFNRAVFYQWSPDVLLLGDSEEFDMLVLHGLHQESVFRDLYLKCSLSRNGYRITACFSRTFLASLPEAGDPAGEGDFKIDMIEPVEPQL